MQKGDRFVVEVSDVITDSNGKQYAKIKGFNTLMFDDQGINKLEKFEWTPKFVDADSEMAYHLGYGKGLKQGWLLAQRIAETTIYDLCQMGLYNRCNDEDEEYQVSCEVINTHDVEEVALKITKFDSTE